MRFTKFLFPLAVVWVVLALIRRAFARSDAAEPASGGPYETIDEYIEREMRRLKMPGVALAIVEGDQIVHERGFGRARPDGEAPTPQTQFLIGSLAKSITAMAVMQLVEAGKIELDAPIQRYLPWFRVADAQASAAMTVRHLLNQTSGLPTWTGDAPLADFDISPDATERQARTLATVELAHPVGAVCQYNNMNYNLLGLIIEAASGLTYTEYVQEHIFNPLGMSQTTTSRDIAGQNGLAMGHRYWFGFPVAAPNLPTPHGSLPSGQLVSSAEDMAHYLIAHLNGGRYGNIQVLSAAGIVELRRGVKEYGRMGVSAGKYGMGWFVDKMGQTEIVWHGGTMPHFGAHMVLLPEQKKGMVLLFNGCHFWYNPVLAIAGGGATALLAGEEPPPGPPIGLFLWLLRGQLLIPAVQIISVLDTLRLLGGRRLDPEQRPAAGHIWGRYILLPLIPNLLAALTLIPMLGKTRGYLRYFMPDFSWLAIVCGSFALVWSVLRTGLVLGALKGSSSTRPSPR